LPEAVLEPPVVTDPAASTPPGWVAGLPDPLKTNEAITKFKTVGEFANDYLATTTKVSDLEKRVANSVPKLPDDATDEDRSLYYDALGRPKQPSEYEFDGEDKNAPEWTNFWKQEFHADGLTKTQAKNLSAKFNGQMQKMVEAHNVKMQNEVAEATEKLKNEWGTKFDTNVELAKRLYQKHIGNEFDKDFDAGTGTTRLATMRLIMKFAALTGEDRSPQGNGQPNGEGKQVSFIAYDKSPAPPKR
jgi:hypothetical protein